MDGKTDVLRRLLQPFRDVYLIKKLLMLDSPQINSILFSLVASEHVETMKYVLESFGLSRRFEILLSQNISGHTVAHIAAGKGHLETLRSIVESLSPDQTFQLLRKSNHSNHNVIAWASKKNQVACVKYMLDTLGSTNCKKVLLEKDFNGHTILQEAIDSGHIECFQSMISTLDTDTSHSFLRGQHTENETPFHWAAINKDALVVKRLLSLYSDFIPEEMYQILLMQNPAGSTALSLAASQGRTEALHFMVTSVDNSRRCELLTIPNIKGQSVLHLANAGGHERTFQAMLAMLTPEEKQSAADSIFMQKLPSASDGKH